MQGSALLAGLNDTGIAQRHELPPTWQQDRIIEGASPSGSALQPCDQLTPFRDMLNVQVAFFSGASAAAIFGQIVALS